MNHMYRFFLKKNVFLPCLFLLLVCTYGTATAQTDNDMDTFLMYYEEKDLVISSTRSLKPASQAAENITVIHKENIEEINAHTVAEVLKRETGLFVQLYHMDFAATSLIEIQGAFSRHVLVLLDGITWNNLSTGSAETLTIPVGIIDRIEIIKGPASSVWGSSLGGVVNIITKPAGTTKKPQGMVMASYGQNRIQDFRADMSGKVGAFGYYLYAGRQDSDMLVTNEPFTSNSFYSKVNVQLSKNITAGVTGGISNPSFGLGDGFIFYKPFDELTRIPVHQKNSIDTFFLTSYLDTQLSENLNFTITLNRFLNNYNQTYFYKPSDSFQDLPYIGESNFDEMSTKGDGKLVWSQGTHTVVVGIEFENNNLEQIGLIEPPLSGPEQDVSRIHSGLTKEAIFINDTVVLERLSIVPGIRFDHNSLGQSFLSPSLGMTYKLSSSSILKASVARGFTTPSFIFVSGDTWTYDPNPSLIPENVWSFQAGIESSSVKYLTIKAALFGHDLKDAFKETISDDGILVINNGETSSKGAELELETDPFYNLSLMTGFAYVNIDASSESEDESRYGVNIGIRYDDSKSFNALLFGHYEKRQMSIINTLPNEEINSFVWDLHVNKNIYDNHNILAKIFLTAHNIFNSTQSHYETYHDITPEGWIEAGITLKY